MRKLVTTLAAIVFIATSANAQTATLVTMKSGTHEIDFYLHWIPSTAVVKANGVELTNSYSNTISVYGDSIVFITTEDTVQIIWLDCSYNQLTELDVSKNTALVRLECDGNQLTQLDVSNNLDLKYLQCRGNQLTLLDMSKNTELTLLSCDSNQLTQLDVSNSRGLMSLYCSSNQLPRLDISNTTSLSRLYADNQQIEVYTSEAATSFLNPVFYKIPEGEQTVQIGSVSYAYHATVPKTEDTMGFTTSLFSIVSGNAFGGTITFRTGNSIVETQDISSSVQVYPNPAQNELTIENGELRMENVAIFDICGKLLNNYQLSNGNSQLKIDVSYLASGIYLVKVKTAQGETIKKIVKQ